MEAALLLSSLHKEKELIAQLPSETRMARLLVMAIFLVGLVAMAEATIYRTTITTVVQDDDKSQSQSQSGECRKEIQKHQLNECRQLMRSWQTGNLMRGSQRDDTQGCCEELQNMRDECTCEAIQWTVQQQQQQSRLQGEEMERLMKKAEKLPSICDMSHTCQFGESSSN
uniref:Bifunctional inhibitor/plant lipid transfer protein/seed storage helical domain-containing protein n=1 Tax=Nelumbo nucifera TaxID=4432 RepID=A0A822XWA0_NELNU|nr:TPA_asm: hypothetical protein HUJ06_024739 [Nelumbo nucifera]